MVTRLESMEQARSELAAMTSPATYTVGDYITFVALANAVATVKITEMTEDGETSYAFSNGQTGLYRDHRPLALWRPASPAEIDLYVAHAVDHLGDRVVLPLAR